MCTEQTSSSGFSEREKKVALENVSIWFSSSSSSDRGVERRFFCVARLHSDPFYYKAMKQHLYGLAFVPRINAKVCTFCVVVAGRSADFAAACHDMVVGMYFGTN